MSYRLLSVNADAKTRKGHKRGYLTGILYLAPAQQAGGRTMCPSASPECIEACLATAGRAAIFATIPQARIRKTLLYLSEPWLFFEYLTDDVERLIEQARRQRMIPCVRINGTSDQPLLARRLAARFPHVQFYDYTKIPQPWRRTATNYSLTFSYSGHNLTDALNAIEHGINVSVVFNGPIPAEWHGVPVINGDSTDLRFLDPKGVIVGLRAKGKARQAPIGGFVQCDPRRQVQQPKLIQLGAIAA